MFGRLERVSLKDGWNSEPGDFTPWLADENNLALLSEVLEMDLALVKTEAPVGSFKADILCIDQSDDHVDDHFVLIENQLTRTNHDHLGKLLTYAAGLKTVTIVWIAANFTEQHRAALDWLNEITDERFRFFGLEVELWRIGSSVPAPKLNIVAKPNDWSKIISQRVKNPMQSGQSDIRQAQLSFWTEFNERLAAMGGNLKGRSPGARQWYSIAIGRSGYNLAALFVAQKRKIGVELYFSHDHAHEAWSKIAEERAAIEHQIGCELEWIKAEKHARIVLYKSVDEPLVPSNWPEMLEWLLARISDFDRVFRDRIKRLPDFKPDSVVAHR